MPWGSRRPLLAAQGSLARPRAPWCRMAGAQENTKIYCIIVILAILGILVIVIVAGSNWRSDQGYGPILKRCQGYLILLVVVVLLISWSYVHKLHITHCILHLAYCTLHITLCTHYTHYTLHTLHIALCTHCTHCRSLDHGCTHPAPHCQAGAVLHTLITCYPSNLHQSTQLNHRKCKWMANEGSENIAPNGTGQYWWWAIIAEIFVNQVSGGCRRNCLHLSDKIPLRFPSFFLLENFKCWSYLWCKAYSFWTK